MLLRKFLFTALIFSSVLGFAQADKSKKQLKAETKLLELLNENFGPAPHSENFTLVKPFQISDQGILSYTIHEEEYDDTYRLEVPIGKVVEVFHDLYFSLRCDEPVVRQFVKQENIFTESDNHYKYLFYMHIYGDGNEILEKKITKALKKVQKFYKADAD